MYKYEDNILVYKRKSIRIKILGKKRSKNVIEKMGKKILVDGIFYNNMSEAERLLNKSRHLINKQHKIELL